MSSKNDSRIYTWEFFIEKKTFLPHYLFRSMRKVKTGHPFPWGNDEEFINYSSQCLLLFIESSKKNRDFFSKSDLNSGKCVYHIAMNFGPGTLSHM